MVVLLAGVALDGDVALPDHRGPRRRGCRRHSRRRTSPSAVGVGRADRLAHQVAVGHAPDLDGQLGDVDGLDADAVGLLARQDHALAGEADVGRLVAEGEVDVGVGGQGLAGLGAAGPSAG